MSVLAYSFADTADLTARDLAALAKSYITPEIAAAANIRRADDYTGAEIVGRSPRPNTSFAGLVFPYRWPGQGGFREMRLRRDTPDKVLDGDKVKEKNKYLTPPGRGNLLYFAPGATVEQLHDTTPIIIVEGEKKTLALDRYCRELSDARLIIGLAGVWSWRGTVGKDTNPDGHGTAIKGVIPDFDRITWDDRDVEILFDANCKTNREIAAARRELQRELVARGAIVRLIDLPDVEGCNGVDDILGKEGPDFITKMFAEARAKQIKKRVDTIAGNVRFVVDETGVTAIDGEGARTWCCAPLWIEAVTRNPNGDGWGRLLRWNDGDGRGHSWAMPMSLLANEGAAIYERLMDSGLMLSPFTKARTFLRFYLSTQPNRRVRCVSKTGWHGATYVLPDETIGPKDAEPVFLQSDMPASNFRQSGTLEEWRENVAAYCRQNSRLLFSVSTAFASVLLPIVGEENGIFHLRGDSSQGKSTSLYVAGSVWGGGQDRGYLHRWRATINGLEGIATAHNHGFLCLDEMAECNPVEIGNIVYMLGNGQGKVRMAKSLTVREALEWRLLALSTGEIRLSQHMATAGQKTKTGQEVRLVNIESDAGKGFGLFDHLHDFTDGAQFSKYLVGASTQFYGTAVRAWLRHLVEIHSDLRKAAKAFIKAFLDKHGLTSAPGPVTRVGGRFALVAFAGELATEKGITGWDAGESTAACHRLLGEWLADRSVQCSSEHDKSIATVRAFLGTHGVSRFQSVEAERIVNRAGFRLSEDGQVIFGVLPDVFKDEMCRGLDHLAVARTLLERGYLIKGEGKNLAARRSVPAPDLRRPRLYLIPGAIFDEEQGEIEEFEQQEAV